MDEVITAASGRWREVEAVRVACDPEVDALCLRFAEASVAGTDGTRFGAMLDVDASGRIVGIGVLDASAHRAEASDHERFATA